MSRDGRTGAPWQASWLAHLPAAIFTAGFARFRMAVVPGRRADGRARAVGPALLLALALIGASTPEVAAAELGASAGGAWALPAGGAIDDAYDGAPLVRLGVTLGGASPWSGAISVGLSRTEARPSHPVFVENVESRLRWIPILAEARYRLRTATRSPYVSCGLGLWHLRETFAYRLAGNDRETDGSRTALAASFGAGLEIGGSTRFPLRLGFRAEIASLDARTVTADGTAFEGGDRRTASWISIGLEIEG